MKIKTDLVDGFIFPFRIIYKFAVVFAVTAGFHIHASAAEKPIQLIPAKNLDAFYTFTKSAGWNKESQKIFSLVDGMVRITGKEPGCLATKLGYANYRLVAEYKWGMNVTNGDSGVWVHFNGPDTWVPPSIECNLISPSPAQSGVSGEIILFGPNTQLTVDGVRKNGFAGFKPKDTTSWEKPVGQWNTVEILCDKRLLQVKVNGHLTIEGKEAASRGGKIFLQSKSGEIFFRRLDLYPLSLTANEETALAPESEFISIFNGKDLSGWDGERNVWSVQQGAIAGRLEKIPRGDHTLSWTGGELGDFELRFSCQQPREQTVQQGGPSIRFRARRHANQGSPTDVYGGLNGYNFSVLNIAEKHCQLRDAGPNGRGALGFAGQQIVAPATGGNNEFWVTGALGTPAEAEASFKYGGWNDVRILAQKNRIRTWINGDLTLDCTDENESRSYKSGLLALNLWINQGPVATVQFKDLRLRRIVETK